MTYGGGTRFAKGTYAKGICDRSGFEYPLNELVREPGTNLLVHYSESDGKWSEAVHPQNFPPKDLTDAQALRNPRPDFGEGRD